MDENKDRRVVVMDVDNFYALLGLARIGASEIGNSDGVTAIFKHVKKFNEGVRYRFEAEKVEAERSSRARPQRASLDNFKTTLNKLTSPAM